MEENKRIPLAEGTALELTFIDPDISAIDEGFSAFGRKEHQTQTFVVEKLISNEKNTNRTAGGSTCLAYRGSIDHAGRPRKVVVKEFYPSRKGVDFRISRNEDGTLSMNPVAREYDSTKNMLEHFCACYDKQYRMAEDSELMQIMVRPYGFAKAGDSFYIVSDIENGKSLDFYTFSDIHQKINVLIHLADMLVILNRKHLAFLDMCGENVMFINQTEMVQQVKLFDVDSMIDYSDPAEIRPWDISCHLDYTTADIRCLMRFARSESEFERQKETYLVEKVCVKAGIYSLGTMAFELIFDRLPAAGERTPDEAAKERLTAELIRTYGLSRKSCAEILDLLSDMSAEKMDTAQEAFGRLKKLKTRMSREKAPSPLDFDYVSAFILEKYPVYRYTNDIAIIGAHGMREAMFRVLIPGVQMLDSTIILRIFSEDADTFLQKIADQDPGFIHAVRLYTGEEIDPRDSFDPTLIDCPLAEIHLYRTEDENGILRDFKEKRTGYVLCMTGNAEKNRRLAAELMAQRRASDRFFAGYIDDDEKTFELPEEGKGLQAFAIATRTNAISYDEHTYISFVERLGADVHSYYYLGAHSRASAAEAKKDYESSDYNRRSSQRSALHMLYKMASIGITDRNSDSFLNEVYHKLFEVDTKDEKLRAVIKRNFDKLCYLEHRSWEAFMLLEGWNRLPLDEFAECAYQKGRTCDNDWKDRNGKRHPFLAASRPGRGLKNGQINWEKEEARKEWDELDRVSFRMYRETRAIAEERKSAIRAKIREMQSRINQQETPVLYAKALELKKAFEKCYDYETNAGYEWVRALQNFVLTYDECGLSVSEINDTLEKLPQQMQPVLEALKKRDAKQADEDVIRSIPLLISRRSVERKGTDIVVIKPVAEHPWENAYSSLLIRPDRLVLLSESGKKTDTGLYRAFFDRMGMKEMKITATDHLTAGITKSCCYMDATGLEPHRTYELMRETAGLKMTWFDIKERRLHPWDDPTMNMLQHNVRLTAEDTLFLAGAADRAGENSFFASMLREHYERIWSLYREIGGTKWKSFIQTLNKAVRPRTRSIDLRTPAESAEYRTERISGLYTAESGIGDLLEILESNHLLKLLDSPGGREERKRIRFETTCPELGRILTTLVRRVNSEGLEQHNISLLSLTDKKLVLADESLFEHFRIDNTPESENLLDCLEKLCAEDSDGDPIQELEVYEDEAVGGRMEIRFAYASRGVREIMEDPDLILEVLIYCECYNRDIFDDIRLGSGFDWGENAGLCSPICVIGVRDNRTYLISAQMGRPENCHAEELRYLNDRFSIDGQPILVSAFRADPENASTAGRREEEAVAEQSGAMGVCYVDSTGIEDRTGRIVIGETISRIVQKTL